MVLAPAHRLDKEVGATRSASSLARGILLLSIGLFWMALYLYVPILSPYVVRQGGSLELVGAVVAAYGVPQLLCRIPLGVWSDALGWRKPFLVGGFAAAALSAAGMWLWPWPAALVGWRLVAGLAASMWAMFSVAVAAYYPPDRGLYAMSLVSFANQAGQVLASYGGGWLAQHAGWGAPFAVAAGVAALGGGLVLTVPENRRPPKMPAGSSPVTLLRSRATLRVASGLGILAQVITFVTTFGYVPIVGSRLGLDRADLGLLLLVGVVPTAVASLLTGTVRGMRLAEVQLAAVGFALAAGAAALTPLCRAALPLFAAQAFMGIGRGILSPTLMALAIRGADPAERGTALATYQATYALGMVGGPALAGWIVAHFGLQAAFWLAAGAGLIGLATAVAARLPGPARAAARTLSPR